MQLRWKSLVVIGAVALSACFPPTVNHPLGTITSDPALIGTWKFKPDSGSVGFYHILTGKDHSLTAVMVPDKGAATDIAAFSVKPSRLGSSNFLNVRVMENPTTEAKDQPQGFVPVLYHLDDKDTLSLYLPDDDLAKAAIAAHKIAGTVGPSGTDDVVISSEGAVLDRFFSSRAGLALFAKRFEVLHRIN